MGLQQGTLTRTTEFLHALIVVLEGVHAVNSEYMKWMGLMEGYGVEWNGLILLFGNKKGLPRLDAAVTIFEVFVRTYRV